jgi:uncharacterized membrane-anchored protein
MKTKLAHLTILLLAALPPFSMAADDAAAQEAEKLANGLHYQQGEIALPGGMAKLNVPQGFRYLNPEDTDTVLVKLWNNPPSSSKTLGMLLPADVSPLADESWAVTISYADDGYVKDNDADKIDYGKLLKQMQDAVHERNKERTEKGYPAMELVGWAEPPRYDAAAHKMYWAKELKIDGDSVHSLNYNIRILGRHGVLVLNAISQIGQLEQIKKSTPEILGMVNFNEGNRYSDFDPKIDKVATYGIAALVAGGVAAKLGIFKMAWVFILAAKKFIIIGAVAISAAVKKMWQKMKA